MFVFFHTFPVLWEFVFPMFWELYESLLHAKYEKKRLTFECFVFPYFSHTIGIHFSHALGTIPLMSKLIKFFYFRFHFHSNIHVNLFTKEVILLCCWVRPNICISDPFVIDVWKYLQCRRVETVFYGSASVAIFLWI